MKHDILEYAAIQGRNRETFLLNYHDDFTTFNNQIGALDASWSRIGNERDRKGQSHAGLVLFTNILLRHAILGFQHITSYQSFAAWLTFRPGLEALLFLGKFVDDPANAKIWRDRLTNRKIFRKSFSEKGLISKSLPRCTDFREVLTRLNDYFMHPNPDFTYRDMSFREVGRDIAIEIQFFDVGSDIHEGHLLAYLNLLDMIVSASESLVNTLYSPPQNACSARKTFAIAAQARGASLAIRNSVAKRTMEELGLWQFKSAP